MIRRKRKVLFVLLEDRFHYFERCFQITLQVWEDSSLADWDPNDFRIFCGDLGNEVSDELLAKAFRKYPSFLRAKVMHFMFV